MATVNIPFKLHKYQRIVFSDPHRFRVTVNGRRWGKTALGVTELLVRGLSFQGKVDPKFPVTVLGVLPTANQARKVIWEPLFSICDSPEFRPLVRSVNRTQMTVVLSNGVVIRVVGSNDQGGDRLRGLKIYFCWMDEMQDIREVAFTEVVRPAMSDTPGSRALFTGTPKGRENVLFHLFHKQDHDSDWQSFNFPTWTNPTIPRGEIEQARQNLPPRLFAQEYQADFCDFPGKWYTELDGDNKYYGEPPRFNNVFMGCDFGDLHPALVVIGRGIDRKYYVLEGYSPNRGKDPQPITEPVFHTNVKRLVKKWGVQHIFCDPSRSSAILSIRSLGEEKGFKNAVAGYNRIVEGIDQVHGYITKKDLLFTAGLNDKVSDSLDGLECYQLMEAYHRLTDKHGSFTDEPADGYFSHICDSIRYCLATKVG